MKQMSQYFTELQFSNGSESSRLTIISRSEIVLDALLIKVYITIQCQHFPLYILILVDVKDLTSLRNLKRHVPLCLHTRTEEMSISATKRLVIQLTAVFYNAAA
jgi:hypothetical protein